MAQSVALNGKLSTSNKQFMESARQEQIDLQKYLIYIYCAKYFLKCTMLMGYIDGVKTYNSAHEMNPIIKQETK